MSVFLFCLSLCFLEARFCSGGLNDRPLALPESIACRECFPALSPLLLLFYLRFVSRDAKQRPRV